MNTDAIPTTTDIIIVTDGREVSTGIAPCPEHLGGAACKQILPVRIVWSGFAGDFYGVENGATIEATCPDCGEVAIDLAIEV